MQDIIKPTGSTKGSKPDAGNANIRGVPVYGVVKNNIDPIRSGRIQVYVSDFGSNDPDDATSWVTVSYMSPFYGFVQPTAGQDGFGDYVNNPSSYGLWNSPPDIGTTVICIFVNGDPNYGYYIGCVPKPEALYMVPAIGAAEYIIPNNEGEANGYAGALRLPVTNINTNNSSVANSADFLNAPKPVHSYAAAIMSQQGIIRDPVRGPISSSAQRESPSRVGWGISTPGRPIYKGGQTDANVIDAATDKTKAPTLEVIARRGGHSIVMDDGDLIGRDQLVRIRSAQGHQILMSDDGQTLFIIHSNGQSYIELGKEGTIDMYSTNSVNIRTQGDLNFHADRNINMHAAKKMNIFAEEMNIQSDKDTNHKVGGNYSVSSIGNYTHKVLGAMSMKSGGDASYASSADTYINGSKINLNTGSSSTTPQSVQPIQQLTHVDTLHDVSKGWTAAPGKLKSITSRTPAHAPWADAGKGVDVKVSGSAGEALPPSPSPAVEATNATAATAQQTTSVTTANISTVPSTNSVSASIDKSTSGAMVGAVAQAAATGPAAAAVTQGVAVVNSANGPAVAVGALAQSPKQLETAGIIKPGTAALIESRIAAGASPASVLTPNMFTGKDGVTNINSFLKNVNAQVNSQSTNFSIAQTGLTNSGVITGKESATAIAGLVMAGSKLGLGPTIGSVQKVLTAGARLPSIGTTGNTDEFTKILNAGNYAAGVAQMLGGNKAVSGAVSALKQLNKVNSAIKAAQRGPSASAYIAVLESLTPLIAGKPQNLGEIARNAAKSRSSYAAPSGLSQTINAVGKAVGGSTGSLITSGSNILKTVETFGKTSSPTAILQAASSIINNVNNITNVITGNVVPGTTSSAAAAAAQRALGTVAGTTQPSTTQSILGVINSIGTITNSRSSSGAVTKATVNLVKGISSIVVGMSGSSQASGLNNLPGGQSLAASSSLGSTDLPGTGTVSSLIKNSFTSATTGTSLATSFNGAMGTASGAINQASSALASEASSLLAKLKTGNTSLSNLILKDLSPDGAAKVNSAIASIASAEANASKIPVADENTFDRSGLDTQITSLLGDPRIPKPNFDGIPEEAKNKLRVTEKINSAFIDKATEIANAGIKADAAKIDYEKIQNSYPQGSPEIEKARLTWLALVKETDRLNAQLQDYLSA